MLHAKTHIKNFCLIEKVRFLKRCINFSIILPSLDCKRIDLDLILIQQKRILLKQITQINSQINDFMKTIWISLNEREKTYCWNIRNWKKSNIIRNLIGSGPNKKLEGKNYMKIIAWKLKTKKKYIVKDTKKDK